MGARPKQWDGNGNDLQRMSLCRWLKTDSPKLKLSFKSSQISDVIAYYFIRNIHY